MSEMKYQKEFEEFVRKNPEFLGGNTLTVQRENYGVSLNTPEYAASYVRFSYEMFCKIKEQLEQELELLKLERDEFKKYSTVWFDKKNELQQELQKTREQLEKAENVIEFYADGDNYGHISPEIATYSVIDASDLGAGDFMLNDSVDDERVGGKRARQYFQDKENKDKK